MIRPQAELPARMVKWLVNNRRGNIWYSTRETAMAVYALAGARQPSHAASSGVAEALDF